MIKAAIALQVIKPKLPKIYSLQEYLKREEKTIEKHEFCKGQILIMPNAKFNHQLIIGNAVYALKHTLLQSPKKYLVIPDGLKVYIEPENIMVYPDALVIYDEPVYYQNNESVVINPILIIEVLSKSTRLYDNKTKFELYTLLPSFKEYVLIDTRKPNVETRFREQEDLWRIKGNTDINSEIYLKSIGINIRMADFYDKIKFNN